MVNQQILAFIARARSLYHMSEEAIKRQLLGNGWKEADVNEAMNANISPTVPTNVMPPVVSTTPDPSPAPTPAASPTPAPITPPAKASAQTDNFSSTGILRPIRKKTRTGIFVVLVILLILAGGAAAYGYIKDIGPFNQAPYSITNVVSAGLVKTGEIQTARYTFSLSLAGSPKDVDARAFTYNKAKVAADIEQLRPAYERDMNRLSLLSTLLEAVRFHVGYDVKKKAYPKTLAELVSTNTKSTYITNVVERHADLLKDFTYMPKPDGTGYKLTVQFETPEATKAVTSYNYHGTTTKSSIVIDNSKVTINEKITHIYTYGFKGVPPKPPVVALLESRDQMLSYIPSDLDFKMKASGVLLVQGKEKDNRREAEMSINADANLGDSSYSLSFDFKLLDEVTFFRINKFPSLPFLTGYFDVAKVKGRWVKITREDQAGGLGSYFVSTASLSGADDQSQKNAAGYKKLMTILQEEKTILAKGDPVKDSINGEAAYKYEFSINKSALLPTYTRYLKEVYPIVASSTLPLDTTPDKEIVDLLQSEMFASFFEDLSKNTSFSVWFNKAGFPIRSTYRSRMIPLEDTSKLKDQQFVFEATYDLSDINAEITISEPAPVIDWNTAIELATGQNLVETRLKGTRAAIKANASSFRAHAEIYYDTARSYGREYPKASCINASSDGTSLFTATSTEKVILAIKEAGSKESRCAGNAQSYAAAFELPQDAGAASRIFFCVDHSGVAKEITTLNPDETIVKSAAGKYSCK